MKRKVLLSMALLSAAIVAGSTPLTSYAAEIETKQILSDKCYKVYVGQGIESLSQILKEICNAFGSNGKPCPDEEKPDVDIPEIPVPPIADVPEISIPPIADAPEISIPPVVENPDTQEPEISVPDEETLSYAEQVVKLVNEERAKAGLPALKLDADITKAANVRAIEIKQKFSHTRPDGSSFSSVLKEQGVSYRGSGENIAWGQKTPEQVMNGWMNSDGHRANILNKNYKNIGVGYYQDANGVNYWVQLFTY